MVQYALYKGQRVKASAELEKSQDYRCCLCKTPMILKKGLHKIPHFAHRTKTLCDRYSEPDTAAHNAMKDYLQELLSIPEMYREYGKIKKVRPDLLWRNRFAIEVQHSPIQPKEIARRNKVYLAHGLVPLWIFHAQEIAGNNLHDQGKYLQDCEVHVLHLCHNPTKKCCKFKEYPVFCPKRSCDIYSKWEPLKKAKDVGISCPQCESRYRIREVNSTIICQTCGSPIELMPAQSPNWQRVLTIFKLKEAEAYLLSSQEILCYMDFSKNLKVPTSLYLLPLTKVMNRKTHYFKNMGKKSTLITSREQFEEWAARISAFYTQGEMLRERTTRIQQKKYTDFNFS